MSKKLQSAVAAVAVCFAMAAGAQDTVRTGKDGSVRVNSGGTKVDVKGGKVNVKTPDSEVQADADGAAATSAVTMGSTLDLTGDNRQETLTCKENTEVSVSGDGNKLTLTGDCQAVNLTGSDNKVTVDGVEEITITGDNNSITWKRVVGGAKKPAVTTTGSGNKVSKAK